MKGTSRLTASTVGVLVLLSVAMRAEGPVAGTEPVGRVAALAIGSIFGTVQDEKGAPIGGATVSALGATRVYSFTDRYGRFELRVAPGPYLVRAHLAGFIAPRGQIVEVRANSSSTSSIALRRATIMTSSLPVPAAPVLAAGVDVPDPVPRPPAGRAEEPSGSGANPADDDHSELAWRLRHLRRGVLQDVLVPDAVVLDQSMPPASGFTDSGAFGRTESAPIGLSALGGVPLSGQFNLLTTSSFDNPQQLFSSDTFAHNVAYISVGAPAGENADWAVRGAFTQADISSWVVAGAYATKAPARHQYELGLSYATQRYDGGNPATLRDLTDGSRNAGAIYGFDTYTITPAVVLTFGGRYARYDYLDGKSLISPRVALTIAPAEHLRINALVSRRANAPGAEEFLPPGDNGIWLPPQRTFSPLSAGRMLEAERITHLDLEVERDLGTSSAVSVRAFRQHVDDQLVTMFGVDVPGLPDANVGHYFVGNAGELAARGIGATFRTGVAGRVQASVEYSMTRTRWNPGEDLGYWILQLPTTAPLRSSRIHDVATKVETEVPETSTRIAVLYRISNAHRIADDDALLNSRFDVQVHQALPFMDFSTAKWEMLVGVRNFFRETVADQSVYDELLVVHPPKRIVGGLTMRF
jgi:hypothetical protein